MACSNVQSVLSLKVAIAKLQKQVLELESSGDSSSRKAPLEKATKANDHIVVLPQRRTMAICKESPSTIEAPIPTYNQIFCPPNKEERDSNTLYGKDFLLKYYSDEQHILHCSNLRTIRGWMKTYAFEKHCDFRHNKKAQEELQSIIQNHYDEVLELKFSGATYKWEQKDIYAYLLRHLQAKRKNLKIKRLNLLENVEANHGSQKNDESESIKRDANQMEEKNEINESTSIGAKERKNLCIDTLTTEGLDNFYCPELLFGENDSNEQDFGDASKEGSLLELLQDANKDDEEIQKQGSFLALLQDAPIQINHTMHKEISTLESYDDTLVRKSTRTPKLTEKVKENMKRKRSSHSFVKNKKVSKAMKTKVVDDVSLLPFQELNNVSSFNKEDEETILMKYLELQSVDSLYASLKSSFSIVKRNPDFLGNRNEQNIDRMRNFFVDYLIATKKILVSKQSHSALSVDDISIVDF